MVLLWLRNFRHIIIFRGVGAAGVAIAEFLDIHWVWAVNGVISKASHPADLSLSGGWVGYMAVVIRDDDGNFTVAWGRSDGSYNGAEGDDESGDAVHFGRRCFDVFVVS